MKKIIFLIILLCGLKNTSVYCQWVVNTSVDSNLYWVGDPIKLNLHISDEYYDIKDIKTDTSVVKDPAIEVLNFEKWEKDPTNNTWVANVTVGVYDSGVFKLPEFKIVIKSPKTTDTLLSKPLAITVRSLPVSDTTAIAPIKNIIRTPATWRDYMPWVVGVVAFFVILLVVIYFIKNKGKLPAKQPLVMTPIAAYELALTKLKRLREIRPWEKGKVMEYQIELTHIIRTYISNRYGISAMELSSPEILKSIKIKIGSPEALNNLGNLLEVGDYVKFAKAVPPDEIHEHVMQMALSFIEKTKS